MKTLCLNRINKDIKEITKSPLEGIGIISLDNDPMKYIVNIKIMTGIYEGYCLQLLLTFFDNYPIRPPKILIYPGQLLDNTYHHHIFKDNLLDEKGRNFNKFCFDLLDNDFMSTTSEHTGWNPSYTISSLLLQVQAFLSQPDLPVDHIPHEDKIKELMKSMDEYENIFKLKDENGEEIIKIHTWKNPYPEIFDKKIKLEINNEDLLKNKLKQDLTCFISRQNYIDDNNILLGYPIRKNSNGKVIPIPEILSYDCFIEEESLKDNDNNNYQYRNNNFIHTINFDDNLNINNNIPLNENNNENNNNNQNHFIINEGFFFPNFFFFDLSNRYLNNYNMYKSANNELYDTWLPIYINENHFKKNETTILNYFSILKYGNTGLKQYDFNPKYIFEIMPNIFSEMITKMANEKISSSFIKCFFQYILLYKKLKQKYYDVFVEYRIHRLKQFEIINKNHFKRTEDIDIIKQILEIFILCYSHGGDVEKELEKYLKQYYKIIRNWIYLIALKEDNNLNFINTALIIDLEKNKLLDPIVDIICENCFNYEMLKNADTFNKILLYEIKKEIKRNFRDLFSCLNHDKQEKIISIIINNLNYSRHFNIPHIFNRNYLKNFNYFNIFYNLMEKINRKDFVDNLEKNYGVYLDAENLIKDLKKNMYDKKYNKILLKEKKYSHLNYLKDILKLFSYTNKIDLLNYRDHSDFSRVFRRLINNISFIFKYNSSRTYHHIIKIKNSQKFFYQKKLKIVFIISICLCEEKYFDKKVDKARIKKERKIIKFNCNKINNKVTNKYLNNKKY